MTQTDNTQNDPMIVIPTGEQSNIVASLIQRGLLPAGATAIPLEGNVVESGMMRRYPPFRRVSPSTMNMIRRKIRQIVRRGAGHEWPGIIMTHLTGTTAWTPTPKSFGVRRTVQIG